MNFVHWASIYKTTKMEEELCRGNGLRKEVIEAKEGL